ncbi:sporulation integral membrane protein YlbJ [Pradoshia sp.]
MNKSIFKSVSLASAAALMASALIIMPEESFEASVRGLDIWLEIVFPSLLPFLIISEMLIAFGVVKFLGVFFEPFMRPLFRVPGAGGFVWAMGLASGNPSGAKLTVRLRQDGQLTRVEAERLVSFTSSSNPLFIFGAVSVGFFLNPELGILLALSHYASNIGVGLIMRFYGRKEEKKQFGEQGENKSFSIVKALKVMHRTRLNDKRPFGKILGDAVNSSVQTLLMIGGFIIIFSVINKVLFHLHITAFAASLFSSVFGFLNLPQSLSIPFITGLFEMTLGSQLTSQVENVTLMQQAIITSSLLAFSGFSIQAQVASILAETDIRFQPFFFARLIQTILSGVITWLLFNPVYMGLRDQRQNSNVEETFAAGQGTAGDVLSFFTDNGPVITLLTLTAYCAYLLYTHKQAYQK